MKRLFGIIIVAMLLSVGSARGQGQGNTVTLPYSGVPAGACSFQMLANDVTNHNLYFCGANVWALINGNATTVNGAAVPASASILGTNSSSQLVAGTPKDLGAITWNSGGNCIFAAASNMIAGATLTTTTGQTCTLVMTNPVKWGSYIIDVTNGSGAAATLSTGACGSGTFQVGGGGAHTITLSGSSQEDVITVTFNGTNCLVNYRTNFN